ncbi:MULTISPECIES: phosphoenolpyruvate synthase [unclassified Coleofasciculus]|uniref:phosphoenolpyruvate synthase n=1 Tax=unclassified Coleofasciculus TaxID=2692782 RepID=UPI00187E0C17|nr:MULTISPECIES: phosphoenolpyruvate synthase [unclassified Coleofasciculus]MBE9128381.1 phosphoenolpyruvate synthase [Coleofasciculus sp. LEGE 07081]MBE9147901.1 phosphoenolpyruvate synthase [Coleofasciculus sp. LEGE 07092]
MGTTKENQYIRWFDNLSSDDVKIVGGKNASLGEMIRVLKDEGVRVPDGFATTADAYRKFLETNNLTEKIQSHLDELKNGKTSLADVGKSIRRLFRSGDFSEEMASAIRDAYYELSQRYDTNEVDVAVRSSATAEDLPEASFAGQQETFLNVTGAEELLNSCRKCFASLFTDRAISYREEQGFDHLNVALSVGVQKMVRSDKASAGVMFSIDTETGFPDVVVINAAWGLGENVVQGSVTPDEYRVFKPLLKQQELKPIIEKALGAKEKKMIYAQGGSKTTQNIDTSSQERRSFVLKDEEVLQLGRWASAIEAHYQKPMDMEWAKDGDTDELYILQARPETVQSQKEASTLKTYSLKEKGERLLKGLSIGDAIASGKVCRIKSADDIAHFEDNSILVTGMTDPDWVPIMKRAAGIVTDQGGRTCHAAIVSRELGIPAIVGTAEGTQVLDDGQEITISCAEGDQGFIYEGILEYEESEVSLEDIPQTQTQIMMNIASPAAAFRWWRLPCDGIGLARMEFIINNVIKIHPMALIHFDDVEDEEARKQIQELTRGYEDKTEYFADNLARGIAKIAAAQYPDPVIVRMSDFKTNEYADLIGGEQFEPEESNPMLGFRGASRYYSDRYREGFALECRAIKRVREEIGLNNVIIMIPFCRTLEEADQVLEVLAENGLKRGENGLQVYVMAEIPSNVELADEFGKRFDGFSIGSNDLTQLVLGVDRDSGELAHLFDEGNPAVKRMIRRLIETAHQVGCKVGICGQAPSDHPDFAAFLVESGIDSISLNPDSVVRVKKRVTEQESHQ